MFVLINNIKSFGFSLCSGSQTLFVIFVVFILMDALIFLYYILKKAKKQKNSKAAKKEALLCHLDETFDYTGHQFENYVALVYKALGYKIIQTKKSCDQGIDIIVKKLFRTGIQAKCYSRPVGNKAVQEAAAGKRFYRLKKVMVITNGIFTDSAKALAQKNKVKLIDRKQLAALVKKANQKKG